MRRNPFSCVHYSFSVRVLEPLRREAMLRQIPLQTLLRKAVRTVSDQEKVRRDVESWQRALAVLSDQAGLPPAALAEPDN